MRSSSHLLVCCEFSTSTSPSCHGRTGVPGRGTSFQSFTTRRRRSLHSRQLAVKVGMELNFQNSKSVFSRINASVNDEQCTDGSEQRTKELELEEAPLPTMEDIQEVAREQGLKIEVRTLGPWFQINLMSADEKVLMGSAEGFETRWIEGKILHLEAIRLTREAPKGKSLLGPGFLVGAAAVRYGLDKNCPKAELLAINDDDDTHAKLVRYYSRMGFKSMYELTAEGWTDLFDRVAWGGVGTRMDANCEELLRKWAKLLRPKSTQAGLNSSKGFSSERALEKFEL